nr:PREDICTED: claspin-like [Bemisia tabaci]
MEEIYSEGQRRVREKHISLPYHRPKQRSLDDFLQRRGSMKAIPLRTSEDEMKEVWKQLEEKEKEAEVFYKSEDESEDDTSDEDYCPEKDKNATEETKETSEAGCTKFSDENDKNQCNASSEGEQSTIISDSAVSDEPCTEKSSPLESNVDESTKQCDVVQNTVEFSSETAEKLSDDSSKKCSQQEDSTNFSLHLPESSVTSCADSKILPNTNNAGTDCADSISCNLTVKSVSNEEREITEGGKDAIMSGDVGMNRPLPQNQDEASLKESAFVEVKRDEPLSNQQEVPPTGYSEQVQDKSKSDRKDNDVLLDSDPVFSLHLEDSQDCPKITAEDIPKSEVDGSTKKEEENKGVDERSEKVVEDASKKINWANFKVLLDDEMDEPIPMITLKPNPEGVIVLDVPTPRKNPGIEELMQKYLKHSSFKTCMKPKQPVRLNVVTTSKNQDNKINGVYSETLTISAEDESPVDSQNEKPGAKYTRLRLQLNELMKKRRQEEWQKRLKTHQVDEEEIEDGEKSECEALLDDDHDYDDFNHRVTESEDSDLEENDIDLSEKKKKKKKSAFVDDEAEEDSDEDEDDKDEGDEEDDEIKENDEKEEDEDSSKIKDKKASKIRKQKVFIEEEEYEGDDDDGDDDEKETDVNEDDNWMLGQTKFRSQITQQVLTATHTPGVAEARLNDSKFDMSFETSKFGCLDETELNRNSNHEISGIEDLINVKHSELVTESQVLGLCSGAFQTQPPQPSTIDNEEEDLNFVMSPTPASTQTQDSQNLGIKKISPLLSSDDEEEPGLTVKKKKNTLKFSDDEDDTLDTKEEEAEEILNEESDKEDPDSISVLDEEDDNRSVMYDSEENEIKVSKKDVGQFFDKEAELSESEWDSEDEDEKGLDRMDEELGDREHIDEDEVQKQLGKIHMRQLLDDDQRDIKLLQERFLEDGELHAEGGREKNFRWQNINSAALEAWSQRRDSDDEEPQEEEEGNEQSEELWRKMRAERDAFFKKMKKNKDLDDLDTQLYDLDKDSPKLVSGSEKVKEVNTKPAGGIIDLNEPIVKKNVTSALFLQSTTHILSKGSFLLRSDQILSRVGPVAATGGEVLLNQKAKNSRNFIFAPISPPKEVSEDSQDLTTIQKRKSAPLSPVAVKRLKVAEERKPNIMNRKSLLGQLNFH